MSIEKVNTNSNSKDQIKVESFHYHDFDLDKAQKIAKESLISKEFNIDDFEENRSRNDYKANTSSFESPENDSEELEKNENKGEKSRADLLNNAGNEKEYVSLIEKCRDKITTLQQEKNKVLSITKPNETKDSNVYISRVELSEINYSRLLLEKEISRLKAELITKEKEIFNLKQFIKSENVFEKNLPLKSNENSEEKNKRPLKPLNINSKNVNEQNRSNTDSESFEIINLKKQLHESLKINDKLTESMRKLQDFVKENQIKKIENSSVRPNKTHQITSSFSSVQRKESTDYESFLQNSDTKDLIKYENDIKGCKIEADYIKEKLSKNKKTLKERTNEIEFLKSELAKSKEKIEKLLVFKTAEETQKIEVENLKNNLELMVFERNK